ncbi:unnamed protein product, partial [Mycena citricolor]
PTFLPYPSSPFLSGFNQPQLTITHPLFLSSMPAKNLASNSRPSASASLKSHHHTNSQTTAAAAKPAPTRVSITLPPRTKRKSLLELEPETPSESSLSLSELDDNAEGEEANEAEGSSSASRRGAKHRKSVIISAPPVLLRPSKKRRRIGTGDDARPLARTAASVKREREAETTKLEKEGRKSVGGRPREKKEWYVSPAPRDPPAHDGAWRHPADLPYLQSGFSDLEIARFIRYKGAFSVPPQSTLASSKDPWASITRADGRKITIPRAYRMPLLWIGRYLWSSAQITLSTGSAEDWERTKWELLYVARLCDAFLNAAAEHHPMERAWRWPTIDRVLVRYWYHWLISKDEFVKDFVADFGEEEFAIDFLKKPWKQWAIKGYRGFALTPEEAQNGISSEEFTSGFVIDDDKRTFRWAEPGRPEGEPTLVVREEETLAGEENNGTSLPAESNDRDVEMKSVTEEEEQAIPPPPPSEYAPEQITSTDVPEQDTHKIVVNSLTLTISIDAQEQSTRDQGGNNQQQTIPSSKSSSSSRPSAVVARTTMGSRAPGRADAILRRSEQPEDLEEDDEDESRTGAIDQNLGPNGMEDQPMREVELVVKPRHYTIPPPPPSMSSSSGHNATPKLHMDLDLDDDGLELMYPEDVRDVPPPTATEDVMSTGGTSDGSSPDASSRGSPSPPISFSQALFADGENSGVSFDVDMMKQVLTKMAALGEEVRALREEVSVLRAQVSSA